MMGIHSPLEELWRHISRQPCPKEKLILNAFVEMCSGHQSPVELAKLLEDAKFHGIFIADVLGGYDVYKSLDPAVASGAQWPVLEPLVTVPAMAAATKSIGIGATISTTYDYLDSAARNLGHTEQPAHDDRYAQAEEYIKVMYKPLNSPWRDDAVQLDRARGIYTFFAVPGPHTVHPRSSRRSSSCRPARRGRAAIFAAQHAEAVFVSAARPWPALCAAGDFGRGAPARTVGVLALVTPVLGNTEEGAPAKLEELRRYASLEGALAHFGRWRGIDLDQYGDDEELREVESSAAYALFPQSFKDIIDLLIPELQRRGLFWTDYAVLGGTYRENFYGVAGQKYPPDEHVAAKYRWAAGVPASEHHIPE
ncbi:dimethyl-sulfide monooxygenase [Phialemonium atrogriseum]|uniref:Dimethyl-sulfide monooxygenase n=1 Tax=Phialemonium atrogriseum TaxID=1093897 RepID=A0AAJ0FJQ0_9PEZI|nr:dimethyl-sulfide monooxygenase [Phialemonium atrogriseum]KAK1770172.1 dimethyl-sulfide monooxygenase [Phialemonium atrogriseum]